VENKYQIVRTFNGADNGVEVRPARDANRIKQVLLICDNALALCLTVEPSPLG
jgi:hypothetical protein